MTNPRQLAVSWLLALVGCASSPATPRDAHAPAPATDAASTAPAPPRTDDHRDTPTAQADREDAGSMWGGGENNAGDTSGSSAMWGDDQAAMPVVKQGSVRVTGGLDRATVERSIRLIFGRFRLCYENELRKDAHAAGAVRVRLVIDPEGAVQTIEDAGSALPVLGACTMRGIANIAFPESSKGATHVDYALEFSPPKP